MLQQNEATRSLECFQSYITGSFAKPIAADAATSSSNLDSSCSLCAEGLRQI